MKIEIDFFFFLPKTETFLDLKLRLNLAVDMMHLNELMSLPHNFRISLFTEMTRVGSQGACMHTASRELGLGPWENLSISVQTGDQKLAPNKRFLNGETTFFLYNALCQVKA